MRIQVSHTIAIVALAFIWTAQDAAGQNRGGGGSGFLQQNQQSAFGTQNSLSTGAQSGIGQGNLGGGVGGAQGFGGQPGPPQIGNQTQQRVGGQDGFVGSDADQIRNQFRDPRQQRRMMFDFAIDSLNEMRESRRRRESRNRTSPVRVKVRPRFTVTPPSPAELTSRVRGNLERAMPESAAGTLVTIDGTNARIEGAVKNDYEKKLAAKMLSLTPGIYNVDNQLTIEPTLTSP